MEESKKKVIICGGGLVGSLNACFFAKKGWEVHVYEFRKDPRLQKFVHGRSINLAASVRSRAALAKVDLEEELVSNGIKMHGRWVHSKDGKSGFFAPYGKSDQYILSVNRRQLNEVMLSQAERYSNVQMHFEKKCKGLVDAKQGTIQIEDQSTKAVDIVNGDLILACDGAYSAVRQSIMKSPGFNYSQHYIDHGYIELCILPNEMNEEFKMKPNYFHLWPRGDFTLIALANLDKTFTVTLFAPWSILNNLKTPQQIVTFFSDNFPDALEHIGREAVIDTFVNVKASPLVSVKCSPHDFEGKVLLMGDAAHAMVPFYGQGMNCGFEDCLILQEILERNNDNIEVSLKEYSKTRVNDAHAICDLAIYNYKELCYLVNSRRFRLRRRFDALIHRCIPSIWIPLYSSVTFSRMSYSEVIMNRHWQDKILGRIMWLPTTTLFGTTVILGISMLIARFWQSK